MTDIPAGKYTVGSNLLERIWKGSSIRRYRVFAPESGSIHLEIDGTMLAEGILPNESIDVEGAEIKVKQQTGSGNVTGKYYNLD